MKDHLKEIKERLEKSNANLIAHAPSDLDKLVKVVEVYEEAFAFAIRHDPTSSCIARFQQARHKAKEIMGVEG